MNIQQFHQQNLILLQNHQMTVILQQKVGAGTQGAVHKGFIKNKNEQVAIKIITQLSDREAQILETLKLAKQKHIIRIYAIETLKNQVIIVMELAQMDFYDFMKTSQFTTSDVNEKNQLFLQMVQGVQEFHNLNYFHRDLKPENFVCCYDQKQNLYIKLIDFGISKTQEDNYLQSQQIGTPFYMAPEVIKNENYSKAIDVWALGVIWYEILTQQTFIQGKTFIAIANQIGSISQFQINTKINGLQMVQQEQKEIMKQMICIDTQNRISIDEAISLINQFFKKQETEKIEAKLKKEFEEKEIQMNFDNQRKLEELRQNLKQEKENEIENFQQKLKLEYEQKIQWKENELKKIIEEQQPLFNQNIEEQRLKQELQFQIQMNEYKKQCQLDYEQKIQEIQTICLQQRESQEKKQQMEDEEIKKKINEEAKKLYLIELNNILQEQQQESEIQQKKEQFDIKKQAYIYIIDLLKDTIQNAIFKIKQQKETINDLQFENQDKYSILNSIQQFINDKDQELSQLNQDINTFNTLDESLQFSKFVELETQYKNQIQIHIEEYNMIDIEIQKFMFGQLKKQEQDKQKQKELDQLQEMNKQSQNYEKLKNQYNESQKQIENIKTICDNYSNYNQSINNYFKRLKQNSNQIALSFNKVQQYYQPLKNHVTIDYINLIKLDLQEIHSSLLRLEENLIQINQSIITYEEEIKEQMQSLLIQIESRIKEIEYKINIFVKDSNQKDDMNLSQLQEKQKDMKLLLEQLNNLVQIKISESINEFMQIKQIYVKEKQIIKDISEKLQQKQYSISKIKLMLENNQSFLKYIQDQYNKYQNSIEELKSQLDSIEQNCDKFENKEIKQLLSKKYIQLDELKQISKTKFDDILKKSKQNQESQQMLDQLKEECNNMQSELEGKIEEQMRQIIDLKIKCDLILKPQSDKILEKINYDLSILIQDLKKNSIQIMSFDDQNYNYNEIIEQYKTKSEQLQSQKNKIESYQKNFEENERLINEELNNIQQGFFFQDLQMKYKSLLKETQKKSQEKFDQLQKKKVQINKLGAKINYIELEKEHSTQQKWIGIKKQVVQLDQDLHKFQHLIEESQQSNQYQVNNLSQEFEQLKYQVQQLVQLIPQRQDISQFLNRFKKNNQSFLLTFSLIIILKAYNIERYIVRLKDFQKTQKQKQEKQIEKLKKQINDNNQNQESKKQYQIELQKFEQKKIINFDKDVQTFELVAQIIFERYQLLLNGQELLINFEEQMKDELQLDTLMQDIQNNVNTSNNVKLKPTFKNKKLNQEICNECFDSLEFSKIIGFKKILQYLCVSNI